MTLTPPTTIPTPAALLQQIVDADADAVGPLLGAMWRSTANASTEQHRAWLLALDPAIRAASVATSGELGLFAGALIENGAPIDAFPAAVFDRLGEFLDQIGPEDEGDDDDEEDEDEEDEDDEEDGANDDEDVDDDEEDPNELPEAFYQLERAAAAVLSRSKALRQSLPQKPALLAKIKRYSERYGFLGKMLRVLDDEDVLIVHAPTRRVWRATIGGIADNFQLHLLLLGALAVEKQPPLAVVDANGRPARHERIVGTVPSRLAVSMVEGVAVDDGNDGDDGDDGAMAAALSVESHWQLADWRGLRADGRLRTRSDDNGTAAWIWNEGFPAEIAPFEGTRVIVIDDSEIQRGWRAQRIFSALDASLVVHGLLDDAEAHALIDQLVAAAVTRTTTTTMT